MSEYRVLGELESGVESVLPIERGKLRVEQAVRIDGGMRADATEETIEIADDDLLEVELENGFVLWTTIDRLQGDTVQGGTRADEPGRLPVRYPLQGTGRERGLVSNAIRSLKILGYDLPEKGALEVAGRIEDRLEGDGVFFRISESGELTREDPEAGAEPPTLVLIHGTASATANAYAGLFDDNRTTWAQIHRHYGGRVFGFEHRTLTRSPLENALDLLDALPEGADLHLVSHSRGGLVGDLVAHGGVGGEIFAREDLERELEPLEESERRRQLDLYRELDRRIAAKRPRVERYVRVACPAAGTSLASGRLDVYLSILVNLVKGIAGVGPFLGGLGELVAAVAKERTDPEVLPGLEAQMPKSAFVRLLNGTEHVLASDLTVLAGDSDGLLKNLANLFFWRANDLVVDTRSMYGGARRARRLWYLEENRQVTHVNYFRRPETAEVVRRGLLRGDADTSGFESQLPKGVVRGHVDVGEPTENRERPAVILLPGVMGSHLAVVEGDDRERIWLDRSDLMKGKGRLLEIGSATVEPGAVLRAPYDDFRDYLASRGVHVMPMAYDWRISLTEAADRLHRLLSERLAASAEPLHLVAHSMGGLVASLFIARHAESWRQLRAAGGRLLQVGTPNLGSYVIPRILQGEEKMIRLLAAIDLPNGRKRWARWASRFPGLLELAPNFDDLDFSKRSTWQALDPLTAPRAEDLAAAEPIRAQLADQTAKLAGEGVVYVAGGPAETPVYDPQERRIRFTMRGDGRVTWDSGIPPGVPTWYIPVKHGSLLDCRSAFAGLRELVLTGATSQLAAERPAASSLLVRGRPGDEPLLAARDQVEFIPSDDDLEEAALDMEPSWARREGLGPLVPPCEVSVVHGDLRFVENPVIVGHYRGDPIVHAEAVLDDCLNGGLRSRHQLGIYPGEVGSAGILLRRDERRAPARRGPQGAIVLGLGNVGELTVGGLTRSVEIGLLRYAQTCRDRGRDTSSLKVSALLIGSGEAGLTVPQTVEALLAGLGRANRALDRLRAAEADADDAAARTPSLVFIRHLELVELYHDLALETLHALTALPEARELSLRRKLEVRAGGRRRSRITNPSGWWTRLSVERRDTTLKFEAYGERARIATTEVRLQEALIDRLLTETISQGRAAEREKLPQALFELLTPPAFKARAMDRRDLQLVLDKESAAYPWELLIDRWSAGEGPVGVVAGLLRQLRVANPEAVTHPEENRIVVVGDPPSALPALPGAREEAVGVAASFERRGWRVIARIRRESGDPGISAASVTSALLTTDARILHLAGHGVYDPPHSSGMVLGGGTSGEDAPLVLLTPAEVRQMRVQPELVFVNCCHLGRIERTDAPPPLPKLAANLAAQFIRSGVKAVVAAGWPVDDRAAMTFSTVFYERMLAGANFGEAVKRARQTTYERHPGTNTWGAYQCYGDPGFRLLMDQGVRSRVSGRHYAPREFLDVSELLVELGNLVSRAKVERSDTEIAAIAERRDELRALAERRGWLSESGVLAGLARLHAEQGEFRQAIDLFEEASKLEAGGVTLTDLEQLANYRVRLGAGEEDAAMVCQGIADLRSLVRRHGATAERHGLLGGSYKRLAKLCTKAGKLRESLHEMTVEYVRAAELAAPNWYYPATNAVLGVALLGGPWDEEPGRRTNAAKHWDEISWARRETLADRLATLDAVLRAREIGEFWDAVALPDYAATRAVVEGDLAERRPRIVEQYRQAIELYGSGREIDSVLSHWRFVEEAARRLRNGNVAEAVRGLREALAG